MSVVVSVSGTPVATTRVRFRGSGNAGIAGLSSGANGEMEQGAITIEDITYDFDARGWQTVACNETDTTAAPRLFTGYIGEQTYDRGEHYRVADDRQIDLTINDTNVLLANDLLLAADSPDRPAEDDAARIAWLLGTVPLSGRVFDLGLIDTIGEQYDATSFLHQSPADVLNDLCAARGNIFFTYWDQDAEQIGLFYDRPIDTTFTCTLTFSNDLDDLTIDGNGVVTGTCFPPYQGSAMLSDPSEIYCRVIYVYKGGAIAVHDDATHAAYLTSTGDGIPDPGHRTILVENDKVGRSTTATNFANRLLEHYSVERRTVTFTTRLHSTQVGLVQAGMRVGLKFTHLPELSTQQYFRIETLTLAPTEDEPDRAYWDAEITASVHGLGFPPGTGGGSTETFPPVPPEDAGIVQTGCGYALGSIVLVTFPSPITAGHMLVVWVVSRGDSTSLGPPDGTWTQVESYVILDPLGNFPGSDPAGMWYKIADSTEAGQTSLAFVSANGSSRPKGLGWELSGVGAPTDSSLATLQAGAAGSLPAVTVSAGISIAGIATRSDNPEPATLTPNDHFYVEAGDHFFSTALGADKAHTGSGTQTWSTAFTVSGGGGEWGGIAAFFPTVAVGSGEPPKTGQPVGPETVTMSGADGTTAFRFAAGTLQVFVDNTDQTGAVIAQDGAAGTFTLGFTPWVGEVVTVYYKGI